MIEANIYSTGAYASALASKDESQQDSVGVFVPPVDAVRYNTATHGFEKWNGTAWVAEIVAGTGESVGLSDHLNDISNPHLVSAAQIGAPTSADLTAHTGARDNPHFVTAAQVGAPTSAALTAHTDRSDNPHAVTAAQVGAPTSAALTAHTGSTSNPHNVTAAQVGAPSAGELTAHTGNTSNPHAVTAAQIGALSAGDLTAHTGNTSNPHLVTAAQIGAISGLDQRPNVHASPTGSGDGTGRDASNKMNAETLAAYLKSGGYMSVFLDYGLYYTSGMWRIPGSSTVSFTISGSVYFESPAGTTTELQGVIVFHTGGQPYDVQFYNDTFVRNAYIILDGKMAAGSWDVSKLIFKWSAVYPARQLTVSNSYIWTPFIETHNAIFHSSYVMTGGFRAWHDISCNGTDITVTAQWAEGFFHVYRGSFGLYDNSSVSTDYFWVGDSTLGPSPAMALGSSTLTVHAAVSKFTTNTLVIQKNSAIVCWGSSTNWQITSYISLAAQGHLQVNGGCTISAPTVDLYDRSYMAGGAGFTVIGQVNVRSGSWFGGAAGNHTSVAPSVEWGSHSWTNHGQVRP